MTEGGYSSGRAIWSAATDRAKNISKKTGAPVNEILRRFIYERLLARVFLQSNNEWVLKGGTAVLARVQDARTTKDIDLLAELNDLDAAVDALRRAVETDLGDHFRFVIAKVERTLNGQGQPGVAGCSITFDPYVGTKKHSTVKVDLVVGSIMTADPEERVDTAIKMPGIRPPKLKLYPVADHIADKLCAIQAKYGQASGRESGRAKDLVDLVVFARTSSIEAQDLQAAIVAEWKFRGLPAEPQFAPPEVWRQQFGLLARKVAACGEFTSFDDACSLVARYLAPALVAHAVDYGRWLPDHLGWAGLLDPSDRP
ncbi:hypothetical protein GCM10022261_09200 [Brevibacterium daeguense]|uniref:Nucleotidyl transferase AbiEii/AbiGii toxin family protein n=1 Tax=Brevibacterium daeguense TaxID=909936 RepID=A0ABP8EHE8_9MICO|nr:nucleotidyl transferase AbiEii/AbiGii toxin family protein [Brevibacterium daeguense]